jgi:(R,R)-butanediol dehydrogenase / meso-butanediol dehydrogenase / diacetyl reductase
MRAVRLHGIGDLRFEQVATPGDLAAHTVRVRVAAAGICGSDLHNFRTGQWMGRLPTIPGHEFAGEVLEVGAGVLDLKAGDHVVGDSRVNCGECPRCLEARPNICERMGYVGEVSDGAFAELIDLPAGRLIAVPRDLPFNIAALAEPLGVALRVVRRLDPARATPIVIAGAGSIGGLAAVLLEYLGFGPLAIMDRNHERAALVASVAGARIIGADTAAVTQFTGASGLRFAIEASGSPALFGFLVNTLAGGGRLAMVGIFGGEPALNANAIVERELDIRGCSVFCGEQREVLPMLSALKSKLERVISPAITLEQLPKEYEHLLSGKSAFLKSIVEP